MLQNLKRIGEFSDVQELAKVAHQPSQYRALNEIPKMPQQEPTWAAWLSYAGRIKVTGSWTSSNVGHPQLNPFAQLEPNHLLAHFSARLLHLKPN